MTPASASQPTAEHALSPPPARVPGNQWTRVSPAPVGDLVPRAAVSVVICGSDHAGLLPLTLAALSEQTYPASLTEIVVADEGGNCATELRAAAVDAELTLVQGGERLADERSLAEAAGGEVLVFLGSGALPARALLEAHGRWHHAVSDAVSVGLLEPVDPGVADPGQVREAVRADRLPELLPVRAGDAAREAFHAYVEGTRDLTLQRPDLFRVATQRNVALRAETYRAVGGLRDVGDPELARLDLAYRLQLSGAVFALEREAVAHGGGAEQRLAFPEPPKPAPDAGGGDSGGHLDPRVAGLIPVPGFRPRGSGRVLPRPALAVNVAVGDRGATEALAVVDAVLGGRFTDLELRLQVAEGNPDRGALEEALADEPRASVAPSSTEGPCESPHQVEMPVQALTDEGTFERVHALMWEKGLGALRLTVPRRAGRRAGRVAGALARGELLEVVATGPLARARRVAAHYGGDERAILRELFGERRLSGAEALLRRRGALDRDAATAAGHELARERAEHLRHRARAATNQARADRQAQRVVRERMKASQESARADRLEAQLARVSPRHLLVWRSRRAGRRVGGLGRRVVARISARSGRWLLLARQGRSLLRSRVGRSGGAKASG